MAEISIIVPVYNAESYLHRCIDSILNQTFVDFELILINDGSYDSSGIICDAYIKKDNRVYVIHQANRGVSVARNTGLDWVFANSDSKWICFIDSDDWVKREYLEKLRKAAIQNGDCVSLCEYMCTNGNIEKETPIGDNIINLFSPEEYYVQYNINATVPWGKLYKKSCFESVRYPIGKIHEDEAITHQILFKFKKIAVIREALYYYYINPEGITKAPWSPKRLDSIDIIKEQVNYMHNHGYEKAYRYALKKYAKFLSNNILNVKKSDIEISKKYLIKLRFKLKKCLIKNFNILKFEQNKWIYECAFPKIMSIYWFVNAIIYKLKKLI